MYFFPECQLFLKCGYVKRQAEQQVELRDTMLPLAVVNSFLITRAVKGDSTKRYMPYVKDSYFNQMNELKTYIRNHISVAIRTFCNHTKLSNESTHICTHERTHTHTQHECTEG